MVQVFSLVTSHINAVNVTRLAIHRWIQTMEIPYKCSQCEKAFTKKKNLKTQLEIHTRLEGDLTNAANVIRPLQRIAISKHI